MQQVFGLCNGLLEKDRAARRRNLRVRTYAVVPLGPQCGLLEFVPDTEPIGTPIITTHAE
jgi:ataxia telangiectasia mutated family protein